MDTNNQMKDRKKILRDRYEAQLKKIIEEEKASAARTRKAKVKELLDVVDEVILKEEAIDIFDSVNHSKLVGFLIGKDEEAGKKIVNRINKEKEAKREEQRRKRKLKKEESDNKKEGDKE